MPGDNRPAPPAQAAAGPAPGGHPAWFLVVGGAATVVHWAVAVSFVEFAVWPPLAANAVGWLAAVCLSFAGHHRWTFRGHGARPAAAASRFLLVSAAGFAVNQSAYALLLSFTSVSYALLLGSVLAAVAGATYAASRWWVFKRRSSG